MEKTKAMVLKDRNGREIHEGDVLKFSVEGYEQITPYVVTTIEELFEDMHNPDPYYRWDDEGEIIGNIHGRGK